MNSALINKNKQSGQVLLIIVMILTTVVVVLFSISFSAQTETKTTKLEEDQKRAFAAAQSILEAGLQKTTGTYSIGGGGLNLANLSSGFSGSATVANTTGYAFTTPLIQQDQAYTFYLSDYPTFSNPYPNGIFVYSQSETNCPTLEITIIGTDNSIKHDLFDPCPNGGNVKTKQAGSDLSSTDSFTQPVTNVIFKYRTASPLPIPSGTIKIMIIRSLFADTKIGIANSSLSGNLPSQGKLTTAEAQTTDTNVYSSLQLFQSYPQIPADFFVTRF